LETNVLETDEGEVIQKRQFVESVQ
jgi:hypothetical protein